MVTPNEHEQEQHDIVHGQDNTVNWETELWAKEMNYKEQQV